MRNLLIFNAFPLSICIGFAVSSACAVAQETDPSPFEAKTLGIVHELQGDLEGAANYYKFAATKGNARAQLLLANAYIHGRGVPKSTMMAHTWYVTASVMCDEEISEQYVLRHLATPDEIDLSTEVGVLILTILSAVEPDCSEYL